MFDFDVVAGPSIPTRPPTPVEPRVLDLTERAAMASQLISSLPNSKVLPAKTLERNGVR
jgi:hypothetical protein